MPFQFKKIVTDDFFQLLPEDWQNSIIPFWKQHKDSANIYVLSNEQQIIAGGIVFETCSPDMLYNLVEANKWFDDGFLYIGYLYVVETFRGKKSGSKWLQSLIQTFPEQKFWLTVDDENLISFYTKNNFKLEKQLLNGTNPEWLLSYKPI